LIAAALTLSSPNSAQFVRDSQIAVDESVHKFQTEQIRSETALTTVTASLPQYKPRLYALALGPVSIGFA